MDYTSQLMNLCSRRQGREESLLKYIDDMRRRAFNMRPPLAEEKLIVQIVDNANETYRLLLASRPFNGVEELNRHAEYLVRSTSQKKTELKNGQKKPFFKQRSVQATELADEIEEHDEDEREVEEAAEREATIDGLNAMINMIRTGWKRPQNKTKPSYSTERPPNQPQVKAMALSANTCGACAIIQTVDSTLKCNPCNAGAACSVCHSLQRVDKGAKCGACIKREKPPVHCYGCNTPNVYYRNCPKCQKTEEKESKNSTAGL